MKYRVWLELRAAADEIDKLRELLEELYFAIPPKHSYPHEQDAWAKAQGKVFKYLQNINKA